MRKSFVLHNDSLCILDDLNDEQRGQLFYAIYKYQLGEELELSPIIKIAFSQFKNQFQRDNEKYENTCKRRAEAGSKGGKQKVANASKSKQKVANVAENDSKSDNDNVSDSDSVSNIIEHLNFIAGTKFKAGIVKTKSLIRARLNEGYTIEDFQQVHINKYAEWHNDEKMQKFLRPETLYSNKFEGYLNQKVSDNEKSRMIEDHTGVTPLQRLRQQGYA